MSEQNQNAPTGVTNENATALPAGQEQQNVPAQPAVAPVAQNPQPENPAPKQRRQSTRRTGKVARLPIEVRYYVSKLLYDGKTYKEIIRCLEEDGITGITRQNITNWAKGGYLEWKQQRAQLESVMAKRENLTELSSAHGRGRLFDLSDVNNALLANRYNEILQNLDTKQIAAQIAGNPELLFRFAAEETLRQQRETESISDREHHAQQRRRNAESALRLELGRLNKEKMAEFIASANTPRFDEMVREMLGGRAEETLRNLDSSASAAN